MQQYIPKGTTLLRRGFRNSAPPRAPGQPKALVSLAELPSLLEDRQLSDVCIGIPSNQGNLLRVLLRQRLTMVEAVARAGELAEQLAGEHDETVLSRSLQPSAAHLAACSDGCQVWLDYDLGTRTVPHPKVVRRLTLLLWVRPDPSMPLSHPTAGNRPSDDHQIAAALTSIERRPDD